MAIKEVIIGTEVVARLIPADDWANGLGFYSKDEEFIQVGTWQYGSGKDLKAHIHNRFDRNIDRTQEVLYVRTGSLIATVYDLKENMIDKFKVNTGDTLILMNCGHGYRVLENNTSVLEVKNGPYHGAEKDRKRI